MGPAGSYRPKTLLSSARATATGDIADGDRCDGIEGPQLGWYASRRRSERFRPYVPSKTSALRASDMVSDRCTEFGFPLDKLDRIGLCSWRNRSAEQPRRRLSAYGETIETDAGTPRR